MFLRLSFVMLIFALGTLGTPVKRDATKVESDIQEVDAQTQSLDESINAFTGDGDNSDVTAQFGAIEANVIQLANRLEIATSDTNASPMFTETEADTILGSVQKFTPDGTKALNDLVAKKSVIDAYNASGAVKMDLETLKDKTDALGEALLKKLPVDKQSSAQAELDEIDDAFTTAIDAFD